MRETRESEAKVRDDGVLVVVCDCLGNLGESSEGKELEKRSKQERKNVSLIGAGDNRD